MKSKVVSDNIFRVGVESRRNFVQERISQLSEFSQHFSTFFHKVAHKFSHRQECQKKGHVHRQINQIQEIPKSQQESALDITDLQKVQMKENATQTFNLDRKYRRKLYILKQQDHSLRNKKQNFLNLNNFFQNQKNEFSYDLNSDTTEEDFLLKKVKVEHKSDSIFSQLIADNQYIYSNKQNFAQNSSDSEENEKVQLIESAFDLKNKKPILNIKEKENFNIKQIQKIQEESQITDIPQTIQNENIQIEKFIQEKSEIKEEQCVQEESKIQESPLPMKLIAEQIPDIIETQIQFDQDDQILRPPVRTDPMIPINEDLLSPVKGGVQESNLSPAQKLNPFLQSATADRTQLSDIMKNNQPLFTGFQMDTQNNTLFGSTQPNIDFNNSGLINQNLFTAESQLFKQPNILEPLQQFPVVSQTPNQQNNFNIFGNFQMDSQYGFQLNQQPQSLFGQVVTQQNNPQHSSTQNKKKKLRINN